MDIQIYSYRNAYAHEYIALDANKNYVGKVVLIYDFKTGYFRLDHMWVEPQARKKHVAKKLIMSVFNDYKSWFKRYGVYATSLTSDGPDRITWGNFLSSCGIRVGGSDFSYELADKALYEKYGSLSLIERFAIYVKKNSWFRKHFLK